MKIKLKNKYTEAKGNSGGKSGTSNSSSKTITMQKMLMKNPKAIELHYESCAVRGLFEQIPTGHRAKYRKIQENYHKLLAKRVEDGK